MAAIISNIGARGITKSGSTISYGTNWTATQIQVGYYNASTSYAMQLRFRLDKPCSSIKLVVQGASGSGGTYYCIVSDKEKDAELVSRIFGQGKIDSDIPVSIGWNGSSYYGEVVIEGSFPANTDLYIYVHNNNAAQKNLYGLYSSSWYSKVTEGYELEGAVRIGDGSEFNMHLVNIGNGESFDMYMPYIGDGTNWTLYSG